MIRDCLGAVALFAALWVMLALAGGPGSGFAGLPWVPVAQGAACAAPC